MSLVVKIGVRLCFVEEKVEIFNLTNLKDEAFDKISEIKCIHVIHSLIIKKVL